MNRISVVVQVWKESFTVDIFKVGKHDTSKRCNNDRYTCTVASTQNEGDNDDSGGEEEEVVASETRSNSNYGK